MTDRPPRQAVRPVVPEELEPTPAYEKRRKDALVDMTRYKAARRMDLADDVSLLWEDRRTLKHQIQEMARLEIHEDEPADDALAAVFHHYEDLQPDPRDLVATMFIEVRDPSTIKPRLGYYAGIEQAITLELGEHKVVPTPVGEAGDENAATAVTYMRFRLPEAMWDRLDEAELVVDHPRLEHRAKLPDAVAADPHGVAQTTQTRA